MSDQLSQTVLVPMLTLLIAAFLGYAFALRKHSVERRGAYIEKQLAEFYSPLAGYRNRIRTKSELRERIATAADVSWRELCDQYSQAKRFMNDREELFEPYRNPVD